MLSSLRARESRPGSTAWVLTKAAVQTVLFWTVFFGVIPLGLSTIERLAFPGLFDSGSTLTRLAGLLAFGLGGSLGLTCSAIMAVVGRGTPMPTDCASRLVLAGPYAFVRNPMAIAGITQACAVGLFLASPFVMAYAAIAAPAWHYLVRPWEEADLERRFGAEYAAYRAEVRCWWPRLSRYRPVRTATPPPTRPSEAASPPRSPRDPAPPIETTARP